MYKNSKTKIPYGDIDYEIEELVRCMNEFDGIETIECCFGHYEYPCRIWFKADSIETLVDFTFHCLDAQDIWKVEVDTSDIDVRWTDLHLVLTSDKYKDFPTVDLMVENLTHTLKKELRRRKRKGATK